ncbi:CGNR zinc finger domain-containing protein [Planotetraspora thailandica]|nr:ABATE domain-containing protein [Planotetraspora thailandica]
MFLSGNLALDFAGTVGHRDTDRQELMGTPDLLASWVTAAGLLDRPPVVGDDDYGRAVRLREAVYRLAVAPLRGRGREPGDVALVSGHAALPAVRPALVMEDTGELRLSRTGGMDEVLASIARSAAELLGGPDAARVRECASAPCTRLYVDASRGGSRRWCGMRECGNREKAASFRARHRSL